MIGRRIISVHHFKRLVGSDEREGILLNNGCVGHCYAYYAATNELIVILNNMSRNTSQFYSDYRGLEGFKMMERHMKTHAYCVVENASKRRDNEGVLNGNLILMPIGFGESFDKFMKENKKFLAPVSDSVSRDVLMYFYAMSNGSRNLVLWAAQLCLKHRVNIHTLSRLLAWNERYGYMAKGLRKGSLTAYTGNSESISELVKETEQLRREKRSLGVINTFNTSQKKCLKGYKLTMDDYLAMSKFSRLSLKKRQNFIKKMSTVEDPAEIMRQMSLLTQVTFPWNKAEFLEFISSNDDLDYEITVEGEDFVLLKVNDFDTVRTLGKNTNWCISKNKTYWNRYSNSGEEPDYLRQYMLFDFSKKEDDDFSIVGFTSMFDSGITHAHNFVNRSIVGRNSPRFYENVRLKSYLGQKACLASDIMGVLAQHGIPLSKVTSFEKSLFKWDREHVLSLLDRYVGEGKYMVLSDKGDKMAIMVEHPNIAYFLGKKFMDTFGRSDWGRKKFVFFNFSASEDAPDRIMYAHVYFNASTFEESVDGFYTLNDSVPNKVFNAVLDEYGVDRSIICACVTKYDIFKEAFMTYQLQSVEGMLDDPEIVEWIRSEAKNADRNWIPNTIYDVITDFDSFDYLDILRRHGLTPNDYMSKLDMDNFVYRMINYVMNNLTMNNPEPPTVSDYEDFVSGKGVVNTANAKKCAVLKAFEDMSTDSNDVTIPVCILRYYVSNGYEPRGFHCMMINSALRHIDSWDDVSDADFRSLVGNAEDNGLNWLLKHVTDNPPHGKKKLGIMEEFGLRVKSAAAE